MGFSRHIIQRGKQYSFVCRVPRDLQHLSPRTTSMEELKDGTSLGCAYTRQRRRAPHATTVPATEVWNVIQRA